MESVRCVILLLILFLNTHFVSAKDSVCYGGSGSPSYPPAFPCDPDSPSSSCCEEGEVCYSNGFCGPRAADVGRTASFFWHGCTDATYQSSACVNECLAFSGNGIAVCSNLGSGYYCCYGTDGCDCSSNSDRTFSRAVPVSQAVMATTSSTMSNTVLTSTVLTSTVFTSTIVTSVAGNGGPSSSLPDNASSSKSSSTSALGPSSTPADADQITNSVGDGAKGGLSTATKIGIGLGIPLATIIVLVVIWIIFRRRRRRHKHHHAGQCSISSMPHVLKGGKEAVAARSNPVMDPHVQSDQTHGRQTPASKEGLYNDKIVRAFAANEMNGKPKPVELEAWDRMKLAELEAEYRSEKLGREVED